MKVTLQESSVQVDEVVVTALGIKKEKKALAYSVTEVKSEELNRVKVSNIANSLVGKVAGVNVVKPASGVMGFVQMGLGAGAGMLVGHGVQHGTAALGLTVAAGMLFALAAWSRSPAR